MLLIAALINEVVYGGRKVRGWHLLGIGMIIFMAIGARVAWGEKLKRQRTTKSRADALRALEDAEREAARNWKKL